MEHTRTGATCAALLVVLTVPAIVRWRSSRWHAAAGEHVQPQTGPRVLTLIPARNEEDQIAETVDSVRSQTRPPDRIVVIDDSSTDRTATLARSRGVDVFETVGNVARKAGALNQAYAQLAKDFDYVLEMDADTTLHPRFLEEALAEIESSRLLGGVCSRFFAKPGKGLLQRLQALEYARYENVCDRRRGRVNVLSGSAALLRTAVLPEKPWSEDSLVEDYALTLYLRRNGFGIKSAKRAFVYTDTMPTLGALWRQRVRWERGALDELRREGWKPHTRQDFLARLPEYGAIVVLALWLSAMGVVASLHGGMSFHPIWLAPVAVVAVGRVATVWQLSWRERLIAASFFPEQLYALLRHGWMLRSAWLSFRRAPAGW